MRLQYILHTCRACRQRLVPASKRRIHQIEYMEEVHGTMC